VSGEIRLDCFQGETLRTQVQALKMDQGLGEPCEIPVQFYLIVHPRGNVLFDGGMAIEVARDANAQWGAICDAYDPVMEESQHATSQLRAGGVDPASVRFVLQSPLHPNHSGAIGHSPNAEYRPASELAYAYTPDWYVRVGYTRADFDRDVPWVLLEGEHDDGYDIFGDGVLQTFFTPGRAPGHTALLIRLPKNGTVLLCADACYTRDHWEDRALPGLVGSARDAVASVDRLRRIARQQDTRVVFGHDAEEWAPINYAPDSTTSLEPGAPGETPARVVCTTRPRPGMRSAVAISSVSITRSVRRWVAVSGSACRTGYRPHPG
jgi:N-acyl homoserine lactone hydrolase